MTTTSALDIVTALCWSQQMVVDTDRGQHMRIHLNISTPMLPCGRECLAAGAAWHAQREPANNATGGLRSDRLLHYTLQAAGFLTPLQAPLKSQRAVVQLPLILTRSQLHKEVCWLMLWMPRPSFACSRELGRGGYLWRAW